ncbi:hypothetical protein BOTBODRAFT_53567 [Botryobasidium botryosum FD-172 SS1]|uniref:Uncharacterized protein n=1 Tax=Botryobasidium botryosum (strain FD-172 SS1) TaxID=930990 RepID=A0A067MN02_BOTB1|nr:hypothetical protein BOTBODRAFT_53567 [Botryobasidium botryosum FD-172 SS1]
MGTMRNKRAHEAHRPSLQLPLPTPEQTTDTTDAAPVEKPTRGCAPKAPPVAPTRRSGRTRGMSTSDAAPRPIAARPSESNTRRAPSVIAAQDLEHKSVEELHVDAVMVAVQDVVSNESMGGSVASADEEEYEELDIEDAESSSDDESEAPQCATAGKKAAAPKPSQPKGRKQSSQAKAAALQVEYTPSVTSVLFKYPYSEDQVSYSQMLLDIENVEWAVVWPRLIEHMPWNSMHITLGYQILPIGSPHRKQWLTLIDESDWKMLIQSLRNTIRSERAKHGGGKDLEIVLQNRVANMGSKKGGKNTGPTNLKPQAPSCSASVGDADTNADTQNDRNTQISLMLITIHRRHACQRAQCKNRPCHVLPNGEHHKFNNAELKYWAGKLCHLDATGLQPSPLTISTLQDLVTHSTAGFTSTTKPADYPLITDWLNEIDKDTEDRNRDGRNFAQFVPTFHDLELFRLNELGDIAVSDLQSVAPGKFSFGIASAILRFAKADLITLQTAGN